MTALSTAEAALRRAPDDPAVPVTVSGAEAAALIAELDRLRGDAVKHVRARRIVWRLVENLEERVRNEPDPGAEAFGALWEARHLVATAPSDVLDVADTCPHGASVDDECGWCDAEGVERDRPAILLVAEWRKLIHNVHQIGGGEFGWHWRCGVAEYRDEACRYDQRTDSWDALIEESLDHLRHNHGIQVVAMGGTS